METLVFTNSLEMVICCFHEANRVNARCSSMHRMVYVWIAPSWSTSLIG